MMISTFRIVVAAALVAVPCLGAMAVVLAVVL